MATMTPRERFRAAVNHREPDRVPLDMGSGNSTPQVVFYEEFKRLLGVHAPTRVFYRTHVEVDESILERFSIDTRYIRMQPPFGYCTRWLAPNRYVDEWGAAWEKPASSLYWDPIPSYPLAEARVEDLESYPWPDPDDPGRTAGLAERARYLYNNTDYALIIDNPFLGPLEFAWMLLRGPDFFIDLLERKVFARRLLEIVTDLQIRMLEHLLSAVGNYTEVVVLSDDLGTQRGPFLSIDTYRELIKPCHKKLCDRIKAKADIKVKLHSCGNVYSYMPDFIDAGFDILNPVQVSADDMQTDRLKREFGDRMCFWGAVDSQHVLPFGDGEAVESEVKRRIADLAPGGGYILAPSHNIQAGVPPENVVRLYDSAVRAGRYPLK